MTLGWSHRSKPTPSLTRGSRFSRAALLACPLIFTCYVSISSRTYSDDHIVPSGTPAQDAQVYAYVPFVKATSSILHNASGPDRQALEGLATQWVEAAQKDQLQPLVPISFEDDPEEGARGTIMHAKSKIVAALLDDAVQLAKHGHGPQAAHEALLATQLSETLKYSDFNSVFVASVEEQRAGAILRKVAPHLNQVETTDVRNGLAYIENRSKELGALTRFSRIQYYDYMERMSKTPISIEDVHRTVLLTERVSSSPSSRRTMDFVRTEMVANPTEDGPQYLSDLRVAWASEHSNEAALARIAASLK